MKDLFGNEVMDTVHALTPAEKRKRHPPMKRGYAALPGTGPAGETCRSCAHKVTKGRRTGRTFVKCALRRADWNHSYGTDILAKAPACSKWEAKPK